MARKLTQVTGGDGVAFSDDLSESILTVLKSANNAASSTLITTIEGVAASAEPQIPVRTGKLRDSLQTHVTVSKDRIKATIGLGSSSVDYAYYVKYAGNSTLNPEKSVWQEAVRKPALRAAEGIATQVAGEFATQIRKNRRG